ncbi:hypothetical protein F2P45_20680 [Massilia sp. CCM 8733]|uniref:Uncharacterized protein n=1 Tax=Massilia mucilaginosa TaxID=2609282 RepID=A0ABX0NWV4_9BURK|nr:hypothetical protein [Massilia mucilaginosa]NHZ91403.1 hypothetical protein [Massilia mucilaginosa]
MAISTKGMRRITVNERVYLWRVFEIYDQGWFDGVQVTVAAMDQTLFLRYGLHQPDDSRTAVVARGRGAPTIRTACPTFQGEALVLTPQAVRDLIEWGLTVAL